MNGVADYVILNSSSEHVAIGITSDIMSFTLFLSHFIPLLFRVISHCLLVLLFCLGLQPCQFASHRTGFLCHSISTVFSLIQSKRKTSSWFFFLSVIAVMYVCEFFYLQRVLICNIAFQPYFYWYLNEATWIHTNSGLDPLFLQKAHYLFLSSQSGYCYLILTWWVVTHWLLTTGE